MSALTPLQAAELKFGLATLERFYSKTECLNTPAAFLGPCLMWTGAKSRGGLRKWIQKNQYGNFHVTLPWPKGKRRPKRGRFSRGGGLRVTYKAHRFAYEVIHGPIPEGWEPDHQCSRTLCVSTAHLLLKYKGVHQAEHNRARAESRAAAKKAS